MISHARGCDSSRFFSRKARFCQEPGERSEREAKKDRSKSFYSRHRCDFVSTPLDVSPASSGPNGNACPQAAKPAGSGLRERRFDSAQPLEFGIQTYPCPKQRHCGSSEPLAGWHSRSFAASLCEPIPTTSTRAALALCSKWRALPSAPPPSPRPTTECPRTCRPSAGIARLHDTV